MALKKYFLLLAAIILITLPCYSMMMGRPRVLRSMEAICFHTSHETWMRIHQGETRPYLIPSWLGGHDRVRKPPMMVWLNMLSWTGLDPETARVEELAFRARMMSVCMAWAASLAAAWMATVLVSRRAGLLAAWINGSFFLIIKGARSASYDAHLMGWTSLGVAAGIWAIYSDKDSKRRLFGWLLSGLFLAGGILTKGPLAYVLVLAPLLLACAIKPVNRKRNFTSLFIVLAIGAVLSLPWYMYANHAVPETSDILRKEFAGGDTDQHRSVFYYASLLAMILPWTFFWLPSIRAPFGLRREGGATPRRFSSGGTEGRRHTAGQTSGVAVASSLDTGSKAAAQSQAPLPPHSKTKQARWISWGWVCMIFTMLCCFPMRHQRYLLPLMPAMATMIAIHIDALLNREKVIPSGLHKVGVIIFWSLLIFVSMVAMLFIPLQDTLIAHDVIKEVEIANINLIAVLIASALLLFMTISGLRAALSGNLKHVILMLGCWMLFVNGFSYYGYSRSERQKFPWREQAELMNETVGEAKVYYLGSNPMLNPRPSYGMRVYGRRIIPDTMEPDTLNAGDFLMITTKNDLLDTADYDVDEAALKAGQTAPIGFTKVMTLKDKYFEWDLWQKDS